jgi:hypothetical protein
VYVCVCVCNMFVCVCVCVCPNLMGWRDWSSRKDGSSWSHSQNIYRHIVQTVKLVECASIKASACSRTMCKTYSTTKTKSKEFKLRIIYLPDTNRARHVAFSTTENRNYVDSRRKVWFRNQHFSLCQTDTFRNQNHCLSYCIFSVFRLPKRRRHKRLWSLQCTLFVIPNNNV